MNIDIFPLSEGVFTIGHDKVFHPFDLETHDLNERPRGSLLVEIQPFLLKIDQEYILLDTGLGFTLPDGTLQIHHNLKQLGVDPRQVSRVILSHLHKDHAGGISYINSLGIRELSFPNSTYYIGKQEFKFGLEKGGPSYITEDFDLLANSDRVDWLDEHGRIAGLIDYETVGGHCPYHMTFLIKGEYQTIFFGGDVAPQYKQMKTRYVAKYDFDGQRTMELRQVYAERGKEEDWIFLFYHDVQHAVAHL